MTHLHNRPDQFVAEMVDGFVAANSRWVCRVSGGVVRRLRPATPTVAVVIGGGSGHYPAFGGLVGSGLAHGAVIGNVFASPSADQVYSVARACHTGAGVLLTYGNYTGDVLNFDQAQERLNAEGIPCRTVVVTDDLVSAPRDQTSRRRGIAGNLAVFKIAGGAADQGRSLEEVARIAALANDRCRSFGVAFGGCTLPGADGPLFEVPRGRMAVGVGVHGEPGIREQDVPTADGLADLFVDSLLDERPTGVDDPAGSRATVILNGLGSVKYEELFVVYRRVAQRLAEAGVIVVDPEVGELVTSFDMAGASLTLFWLNDELETLWTAPTDSPGFCRTPSATGVEASTAEDNESASEAPILPSTEGSRAASAMVVTALRSAHRAIRGQATELGRLDAVAGDGDHGIGMQRGTLAAAEAAEAASAQGSGVQTTLTRAADAWVNSAGGASGALWAAALRALAAELSDDSIPTPRILRRGFTAAARAIRETGKAQVRDKTMLDAIEPFAEAFGRATDAGSSMGNALSEASDRAWAAAAGTASLVPRIGRARTHGERSIGTPDPGAVSFAIMVGAVVKEWPHGYRL